MFGFGFPCLIKTDGHLFANKLQPQIIGGKRRHLGEDRFWPLAGGFPRDTHCAKQLLSATKTPTGGRTARIPDSIEF